MDFARHFFEGLDGPASLTFLGILVTAFLIGIVPAGFAYTVRLGQLRRRLANHTRAHQTTAQERNLLAGQLERVRADLDEANTRLRRSTGERARHEQSLGQERAAREALEAEVLAARIEATEFARQLAHTRNQLATVSAQLQSARQSERPRPPSAPPLGAFDVDTLASLRAARTRAESLEARLQQVLADNESLRRQLAS